MLMWVPPFSPPTSERFHWGQPRDSVAASPAGEPTESHRNLRHTSSLTEKKQLQKNPIKTHQKSFLRHGEDVQIAQYSSGSDIKKIKTVSRGGYLDTLLVPGRRKCPRVRFLPSDGARAIKVTGQLFLRKRH